MIIFFANPVRSKRDFAKVLGISHVNCDEEYITVGQRADYALKLDQARDAAIGKNGWREE